MDDVPQGDLLRMGIQSGCLNGPLSQGFLPPHDAPAGLLLPHSPGLHCSALDATP